MSRYIFPGYLALLFCLPLPFAAVYVWGWAFFAGLSCSLLATQLLQPAASGSRFKASGNSAASSTIPSYSYPVLLPLCFVPLVIILQWVWALVSGLAASDFSAHHDLYLEALQSIGLCSFFALTLLLLNTRDRVKSAIWVVVLAGGFQALYGSLMVMSGLEYGFFSKKWAYLTKATGTFVNRNHLAGYLEMTLALGIGFLLASSTRYSGNWQQRMRQFIEMLLSPKVVMRLTLAIMVIGLVMTRSRMGNTAFFASLMIAGGLALLLMRNKSRSTTFLLASLLLIDIAIVGTFFGVEKVADRLQSSSIEKESRDEVSRDTFNMWLENPILGTGAGSYKYAYPSYKSEDVTATQLYDYAHNDYLEFLAEFGIIVYLALVAAVLISLYWAIQAMRVRRNSLQQGLGFAATMGIIAILMHSSVDFNLQIPANAFMFVFLLAIACIARWSKLR
jgi:O-antigen ligase